MWIASELGFFSIVEKGGRFHVRGRMEQDLKNLRQAAGLEAVEIEKWPLADYRWRMRVTAGHLPAVFKALQDSIRYDNFKNRIHALPDQAGKLPAYTELWQSLYWMQSGAN
jgi:hypothetical protein